MLFTESPFFEAVPVPVWVSKQGLLAHANAALRDLLGGLPMSELDGRSVLDFVVPGDRDAVQRLLRNADTARSHPIECTLIGANGCLPRVELLVRAGGEGEDRFECGSAIDISGCAGRRTELDRLNRKLQTVLDVAPVGLALAEDPECNTIHVNKYVEKLLHLPPGLNISVNGPERDLIPYSIHSDGAEVPASEMPMQMAARENREILGVEHDLLFPAGGQVRIMSWAAPLHDEGGRVCGSVGAFLDITRQRQAEYELHVQANRLESQTRLLSLAPVLITDPEGRITFWSGGARRLYGFTPAQAVGRLAGDLLETVFPAPLEEITATLLDAGSWSGELVQVTADRRRITVASQWVVQRDVAGKPLAILQSDNDISPLKAAQDNLRIAQEHLRLAHRAAHSGAWEWDPRADRFTWHEDTLEALGDQLRDVVTLADFLALVHPEDRLDVLRKVEPALAGGSEVRLEFRYLRGDSVRWLQALTAVHRNEAGEAVLVTGLSMDITDQRQAERALRQKQKLESIGLLAGGIAHDFNNLLSAILAATAIVADTIPEEHPGREMLELIDASCERASNLTRQLLAYAGKVQVRPVPVNVAEVGRQTCNLLKASLPERVTVEFYAEPELPAVQADPGQIQQVMMNLLLNGSESMGSRGGILQILLSTRYIPSGNDVSNLAGDPLQPGTYLSLEVTDNGCGMDAATVARIFDPFFTTKFTGRGLGLAAVHGLVRSLQGAIQVASVPGAGSTFRILLPVVASAKALPAATAGVVLARRTEPVLIVDDDDAVRRTLAGLLATRGHEVWQAGSGSEAIAMLLEQRDRLALVVLDLGMPGMDGAETLQRLREIHSGVPVILISGYGEQEVLNRLEGQRVSASLRKPCRPEDLFLAVDAALDTGC